jgi:hypothetical protein
MERATGGFSVWGKMNMKMDDTESAHGSHLAKLCQEYGPDNELLIREVYREERNRLEKDASVTSFIPILACKATRKAIKNRERP